MKVLSLFDGMSCGQIALRELGIVPEVYYASEIDRPAIAQTQLNFPETVQVGDVVFLRKAMCWRSDTVDKMNRSPWISDKTKARFLELRSIDWKTIGLVLAGSPCQGFSFAGKQLAFDDPRSRLFFEFIKILNHIRSLNPDVKFLLENVNMKRSHMRIISEYCGVFPVNINSNLVSAQNRDRWYWTNIRTKSVGLFGECHSDIPQPKDEGILLRDILEEVVDEKYYVSQAVIDRMNKPHKCFTPKVNPEKTGCLTTKNNSGQMSFDSWTTFISVDGKSPTQRAGHGGSLAKRHNYQFIKVNIEGAVSKNQDKSSCFTAGAHSGGYHSDMDLICVDMRGRKPENPSDRRSGIHVEQRLEPNMNGKTNCLTSVQKDNLILEQKNNFQSSIVFESQSCLTPKRTEYGKNIRKGYESGKISEKRGNIQQLEPRADGKTNCLTSVQKDNLILQRSRGNNKGGLFEGKTPTLSVFAWEQNNLLCTKNNVIVHNMMPMSSKNGNGGTGHLSRSDGKTYCLDTGQTNAVEYQSRIRRLTPTECSRLQTVPEWYHWNCSHTQIYRMLGNGWTVKVIVHILKYFVESEINTCTA